MSFCPLCAPVRSCQLPWPKLSAGLAARPASMAPRAPRQARKRRKSASWLFLERDQPVPFLAREPRQIDLFSIRQELRMVGIVGRRGGRSRRAPGCAGVARGHDLDGRPFAIERLVGKRDRVGPGQDIGTCILPRGIAERHGAENVAPPSGERA